MSLKNKELKIVIESIHEILNDTKLTLICLQMQSYDLYRENMPHLRKETDNIIASCSNLLLEVIVADSVDKMTLDSIYFEDKIKVIKNRFENVKTNIFT